MAQQEGPTVTHHLSSAPAAALFLGPLALLGWSPMSVALLGWGPKPMSLSGSTIFWNLSGGGHDPMAQLVAAHAAALCSGLPLRHWEGAFWLSLKPERWSYPLKPFFSQGLLLWAHDRSGIPDALWITSGVILPLFWRIGSGYCWDGWPIPISSSNKSLGHAPSVLIFCNMVRLGIFQAIKSCFIFA